MPDVVTILENNRVITEVPGAGLTSAIVSAAADSARLAQEAAVATNLDRIATEAYRDETAAYAGTTNVEGYYATIAAGLAATTNGQYFGVPGVNGIAIYQNVSGSAVAGPMIPSIDYVGKRPQIIKCTATYNGAGNQYTVTPVDAAIRYTGFATQYVWCFEIPTANDKGTGSVTITVKDGAGTTYSTHILYKRGGINCNGSEFKAGDLVWMRRSLGTEPGPNQWLWLETPNSTIATLTPLVRALGQFGKKPSPNRPLHYYKAGIEEHYIRMRLTEDKYLTGMPRRGSDQFEFVEHDMARFQADTGNCLGMNSIFTKVHGRNTEDLNMQFDVLVGSSVDTGLNPTSIEPPVIGGKFGDANDKMVVSGVGHGLIVGPTTTLATILNDFTTGNVDVAGTINPNAEVATAFYGNKLVKTLTCLAENVAHDIYAKCTWVVTYDPEAAEQINLKTTWDFTDPAVTVTPALLRGIATLFAGTDIDRCQPIVNGVPGAVQVIDLRNESSTVVGFPEQYIFWHSTFPEKQWVVTNKYGYGYTHKENGVLVPNGPYPSYISNFDWGIKLYGGLFGEQGGGPAMNMTGKVVTFETGFRLQMAAPI